MRHLNMVFDGPQSRAARDASMAAAYAAFATSAAMPAARNISLRSPMIDRVHFVKPGCSACGKKAM